MPDARGAQTQLLLQRESTYRTAPSPAAAKIPFTRWNVGRDARRQANPSITASPLPTKRNTGDPTIGGDFTSVLDLRSVGEWLALLLGVPTVGRAVTQQPTNVTGVTIHYAQASCPSGNGTLAWVDAANTLQWTAQGDTAGSAVDVSAGGQFTLASGSATSGIVVTVTPASLPVGNATDSDIAVSGTIYAHAFPVNNTARPSALLELGHSDITKYYRVLGAKLSSLSFDLLANEQNIGGNVLAAAESVETSAFDGSPTTYTQVRACSAGGTVSDGDGTALGTITGATLAFDNQMTGYECADGLEGYGFIDQGDLMITGSLRTVFTGAEAYALARANTSTRLRLISSALSGSDTFRLVVDLPAVELDEPRRTVEGKTTIFTEGAWNAHALASGLLPIIVLENDVSAY